jgi:hypothetical protein
MTVKKINMDLKAVSSEERFKWQGKLTPFDSAAELSLRY